MITVPQPGDILRVKHSGESVCVIKVDESTMDVRRVIKTEEASSEYVHTTFYHFELEDVQSNILREFNETCYRSELMAKYMEQQDAEKKNASDPKPTFLQ